MLGEAPLQDVQTGLYSGGSHVAPFTQWSKYMRTPRVCRMNAVLLRGIVKWKDV